MIILDTSFIVSYFNNKDLNHTKAKEIMDVIKTGMYGDIGITDYVFDETVTVLFARTKNVRETTTFCEPLKKIIISYMNPSLFERSWILFKNQKDTNLSFTDMTLIATLETTKTAYLATFDKAFQKIPLINIINSKHTNT